MTRQSLIGLAAGLLFGMGLALSGMADPSRVRGFLDVFGPWDPTLAFVMAGALLPAALAWRLRQHLPKPLAATSYSLPATSPIDRKLLIGAAIFGFGWGVAGLCPGPALTDLALRPAPAALFTLAMLAGMALHSWRPAGRKDAAAAARPSP